MPHIQKFSGSVPDITSLMIPYISITLVLCWPWTIMYWEQSLHYEGFWRAATSYKRYYWASWFCAWPDLFQTCFKQPHSGLRLLAAGPFKQAQLSSSLGPRTGPHQRRERSYGGADWEHSCLLKWSSAFRMATYCVGAFQGWGISIPWSTPSGGGLVLATQGLLLWTSGHSLCVLTWYKLASYVYIKNY